MSSPEAPRWGPEPSNPSEPLSAAKLPDQRSQRDIHGDGIM